MKRSLPVLLSSLWVFLAAYVSAEPLNPAHVPADAKWVLHVDIDALGKTSFVESFKQKQPDAGKAIRQWLEEQYGIDPREDLHSLTLFSDTYRSHTGSAVLLVNYDQEKVKSQLEEKAGVETLKWEGHTLYTFPTGKQGDKPAKTFVLLDERRVVMASSPERAKKVVGLLKGETPSLKGKESPLVAEAPQGAVFYGAAIDLDKISQNDQAFPILRQHERVVYALGERGSQVFENATFVAESEEVAQKMKTSLDGVVAIIELWAADSKPLQKIAGDVKITREGKVVESRFESSADDVIAAWEAFQERMKPSQEPRVTERPQDPQR